jgi:hypothetical protein
VATAFQGNAFQRNAFQIAPAVQPLIGGWGAIVGRRPKPRTKRLKRKTYIFAADAGHFSLDACGAEMFAVLQEDMIRMDNDFILFASD